MMRLYVVLAALVPTLLGCEKGEACKVGFDFEGKSYIAEWWETEGSAAGKQKACQQLCGEKVEAAKMTNCVTSCTESTFGCQKKTRFGN